MVHAPIMKKRRKVPISRESSSESSDESIEPGLQDKLRRAKPPKIINAKRSVQYQTGSVRHTLQQKGLYQRLNLNSDLIFRIDYWKEKKLEGERNRKQDVINIARFRGYMLKKLDVNLADSLSGHQIVKCLKKKHIRSYFEKLTQCNVSGETIRLHERAIKSLLKYLASELTLNISEKLIVDNMERFPTKITNL